MIVTKHQYVHADAGFYIKAPLCLTALSVCGVTVVVVLFPEPLALVGPCG